MIPVRSDVRGHCDLPIVVPSRVDADDVSHGGTPTISADQKFSTQRSHSIGRPNTNKRGITLEINADKVAGTE
jgi:hypothetical protein